MYITYLMSSSYNKHYHSFITSISYFPFYHFLDKYKGKAGWISKWFVALTVCNSPFLFIKYPP